MIIDLSGKTAIVTGSTGGIGYAIAAGLRRAGAAVVINGRTQDRVDEAAARLRADGAGGDVTGLAADLGTAAGCEALVAAVPAPDILVNNLGIFDPRDVFEVSDEEWARFFEVNVMSGVRLSRAFLPGMAERGWGRVLFLSSESALNTPVEMVHYGVTKTAQLALSRGLAKRMAGTDVTVNCVLPGPTLSEGVIAMLGESVGRSPEEAGRDFVTSQRSSSIIRRAATVEEVANLVVYLASTQASATTGAALRVDGGIVDTIA